MLKGDINMANTWDLTHIFKTEKEFEDAICELKEAPKIAIKYKGKLSNDEDFAEYLRFTKKINKTLADLFIYSGMKSDRNKKDVEAATNLSRVQLAAHEFSEAVSWESPEIISLGEEKVMGFLKKNPEFEEFDFGFEKLFRGQKHVLSAEKEALLSAYSPIVGQGRTLYSMLSVADYKPKQVKLSDGEELTVNQSNWTSLIRIAKTPEDRQKIFETLYSQFDDHKNTYGEFYNNVVQSQLAVMKSRGYESILEEHLYDNNIPVSVFHNLIEVASSGAAPLHKYYEIRRKYLGLEKHRSYDRFLELAKSDKKYTFDEAKEIFWDSIKGFPADFQDKAHEVLKEGYVDVYPSDGKRTGAYSNGGYDIHPYILLNFEGDLNDVFTTAHESGHSIHTLYAEENQPLFKQDYTIFVAEIASTFNEHNLLDYLMKKGDLSKQDKIFLLQKAIDEICATFYRQTLFGHYEYNISQKVERGEPINYKVLSDEMVSLYKTYYGIDISEEKVKPLVWAYIPHLFYTPFYVYQYATSFTASMLIYENVKNGKEGAFEKYIGLLKSGGSEYPIDQVKKAGVDLTTKEPFESVIRRMTELVDELQKLLEE